MMTILLFILLGFSFRNVVDCSNVDGFNDITDDEKKEWKWKIEDEHPCTIQRLTLEELFDQFGPLGVPALHPYPLVITGTEKMDNYKEFAYRCSKGNITSLTFTPDFTILTSSSNSFSDHRREYKLGDYISDISTKEILPHVHHANESWYFFGETHSKVWKDQLMQYYPLPPCTSCMIPGDVALSFGIGHTGSGVQWHTHGPGFAQTLHGRKHWILYDDKTKPPMFHADLHTTRHWMEEVYTKLPDKQRPFECTLHPFDLLYFPNEWYHATLNLDPYTAFVSSFTSEHKFINDQITLQQTKKSKKGFIQSMKRSP